MVSHIRKRRDGTDNKTWSCYESVKNGKSKIDKFGDKIGCNNGSVSDRTLLSAVAYCLQFIQNNFKDIKSELLDEIQKVQCIQKKEDTAVYLNKIETLKENKLIAVDLRIQGLITDNELLEQKAYFDKKIEDYIAKIEAIENREAEVKKQTKTLEDYVTEIDRIMKYDTTETELYGTVIDHIVIYKNDTLIVYFKNLPFGIELSYSTSGKGDKYKTEFKFLSTAEISE
jgi:hypothetical protein